MYRQAQVIIVDPQQEQTVSQEVSGSEAAALLAKYGYTQPQTNNVPIHNSANMTFEEMIAQQEREQAERRNREYQRMNGPRPYTFDGKNVNYVETKYSSLDGENFGIQIQIVSDMPIK